MPIPGISRAAGGWRGRAGRRCALGRRSRPGRRRAPGSICPPNAEVAFLPARHVTTGGHGRGRGRSHPGVTPALRYGGDVAMPPRGEAQQYGTPLSGPGWSVLTRISAVYRGQARSVKRRMMQDDDGELDDGMASGGTARRSKTRTITNVVRCRSVGVSSAQGPRRRVESQPSLGYGRVRDVAAKRCGEQQHDSAP